MGTAASVTCCFLRAVGQLFEIIIVDPSVHLFNPKEYVLLDTFSNFHVNVMSEQNEQHCLINACSWRPWSLCGTHNAWIAPA